MWVAKLLGQVLAMVTPELKASLHAWAVSGLESAQKTANPWDDIFYQFVVSMTS